MKREYLIDMRQSKNVIHLYFGENVDIINGDDWDDIPYEDNCGIVYSEFVDSIIDAYIPCYYHIKDHTDETEAHENTNLCRNNFKAGIIPLFWCINNEEYNNTLFYMGETKEVIIEKLKLLGAILL